jgi:hypothetical protein
MTTIERLLEAVFSVMSALRVRVYSENPRPGSAAQLSEVIWSIWLSSERIQLTESSVGSQPVMRRIGG